MALNEVCCKAVHATGQRSPNVKPGGLRADSEQQPGPAGGSVYSWARITVYLLLAVSSSRDSPGSGSEAGGARPIASAFALCKLVSAHCKPETRKPTVHEEQERGLKGSSSTVLVPALSSVLMMYPKMPYLISSKGMALNEVCCKAVHATGQRSPNVKPGGLRADSEQQPGPAGGSVYSWARITVYLLLAVSSSRDSPGSGSEAGGARPIASAFALCKLVSAHCKPETRKPTVHEEQERGLKGSSSTVLVPALSSVLMMYPKMPYLISSKAKCIRQRRGGPYALVCAEEAEQQERAFCQAPGSSVGRLSCQLPAWRRQVPRGGANKGPSCTRQMVKDPASSSASKAPLNQECLTMCIYYGTAQQAKQSFALRPCN
nr:PREDICTED: uncharacterized protein LOC106498127 [Apteryx mantelli mantelli]